MKKGLLSILAGALLVVGCQNYDDQFDSIETQINALASSVAGLAQVQSDLTSLAGTVSSLASTVNGLGDTIDTAVADGLTDIQADIDAIEAAVADVASSEEVAALQTAVDASQQDLTDLLAASSVFTGTVTVNSVSTLDAFLAMGAGLNIVNGSVNITVETDMDQTKVQTLVDNILTVVADFTYESKSSDIAETTFNNLSGVQSLTLTQGGGYQAKALKSAKNITLSDKFKSSVVLVDFRELDNLAGFVKTGSATHTLQFTKATEMHLTKLGRYATTSANVLTLEVDEAGVIDISALDDVDTDGEQEDIYLSITGPSSITIENFEDGALTFNSVKTVTVNNFNGTITTGAGVENFTAGKLVDAYTVGADIETLNVTGALDPDNTKDQSGPDISSTSDNLVSVTVAGNVEGVSLTGASSLETVVITADVAGNIVIGSTAAGNGDLTKITLTGSKAKGVYIEDNTDITELTIDTTIQAGRGADAAATAKLKLDGTIKVINNDDLTTLSIASDDIETLEISGNAELATISSFAATKIGATAKPSITIKGNAFVATKATDTVDTTATADGAATTDLGAFTTTSGLDLLKTWLGVVAADSDASASVWFDTVESYTNEAGTETTDLTSAADDAGAQILVLTPKVISTAGKSEILAKKAFVLDQATGNTSIGLSIDGYSFFGSALTTANSPVVEKNDAITIAQLKSEVNIARAASKNVTLDVKLGGRSSGSISLIAYPSSTVTTTTPSGQRYVDGPSIAGGASSSAYGLGVDDIFTLTIGGNVVSGSISSISNTVTAFAGTTTTVTEIAKALQALYESVYGPTGTKSASAVATVTHNTTGKLVITALQVDSGGYALNVDLSITAGTVTATDAGNIDWMIGDTKSESDDATKSNDLIVVLEAVGTEDLSGLVTGTFNSAIASWVEITTAYRVNSSTWTGNGLYAGADEARTDVRVAENAVAEIATAATTYNRLHWL